MEGVFRLVSVKEMKMSIDYLCALGAVILRHCHQGEKARLDNNLKRAQLVRS